MPTKRRKAIQEQPEQTPPTLPVVSEAVVVDEPVEPVEPVRAEPTTEPTPEPVLGGRYRDGVRVEQPDEPPLPERKE